MSWPGVNGAERVQSDAFVFFGASGDLAHKKIFPALERMIRHGVLNVPVIGVAKSGWTLDDLKKRASDSVQGRGGADRQALDRLLQLLRYIDGDYGDPGTYQQLRKELREAKCPVHYLAIPPSMFGKVVEGLASSGSAKGARIVVEKPFGRDLASAQAVEPYHSLGLR